MAEFRGKMAEGQPITDWQQIRELCKKYHDFIISVKRYDEKAEISQQQRKYWYAVPVKLYAEYVGCSKWMAELRLKTMYCAEYFIREIEPEPSKDGQTMFSCNSCKNIFMKPVINKKKMVCSSCHSDKINPFYLLSIRALSISDMNSAFENVWEGMAEDGWSCPPPDKNWRTNSE